MYRAVDVMGFAGGFTLGMVQSGFTLVGKREMKGGFGVPNCEVNRHLLGNNWQAEIGDHKTWSPVSADVVFGNPPCSGFSIMSVSHFRGADSPINHCMWAFSEYVSRVNPQIAVFESVQMARTRPDGLQLMRQLRENVERLTNEQWTLYHIRHNAYSLGGAAVRPRYFWLISKIPFGIEIPKPSRLPTLIETIEDLSNLPLTWQAQPYRGPATWWSTDRRSSNFTVDGHQNVDNPLTKRIGDLLQSVEWNPGEAISVVVRRHHKKYGRLPKSFAATEERIVGNDFRMGFTTPIRWKGTGPGRVITGGSLFTVIHPVLNRTITHREAARILGFPDDWNLLPLRRMANLAATHGKGITVDCGRWIGSWIKTALDENPGSYQGELIADREYDINVANTYKSVLVK